ncbi:CopG family transcriptional regulator [bacterium]|nr:CopG family transcriptional regulator [bacterium]
MAKKEEVITFKVDRALAEAMSGISNRSAFIRSAILSALDNTCPLCNGTGVLTPRQADHWQEFSTHHHLEECPDCHERHIVCDSSPDCDA